MSDLRLLVVAADPLVRTGLVTLLSGQPGFQVVGQVEADDSALTEIEIYRADAIIWDLGWEPDDSLILLEEFTSGAIPVIALVADGETASSARLAGANGLLFRDTTGERLAAAASAAVVGLAAIEPYLLDSLAPAGVMEELVLDEELTPRELEVLQLLAEGLANRAIAQQLGISEHTVKFHVNAIMKKTGAQSRTAAVVRATRLGLVIL